MDEVRFCETCAKRLRMATSGKDGCAVLTERIGKRMDCFAWTDDLDWEAKVKQAVSEYMGKGGGATCKQSVAL